MSVQNMHCKYLSSELHKSTSLLQRNVQVYRTIYLVVQAYCNAQVDFDVKVYLEVQVDLVTWMYYQ